MKWPNHGGQPETIKQLFQMNHNKPVLDFSANLNPLGPPKWLNDALQESYNTITSYPDPTYSNTTAAVAKYEGLQQQNVLVTNGGAEAIFLVAKYFENGKACIVHPTFLEYERACKHYHISVEELYYDQANGFSLPWSQIKEKLVDIDVLFLCRPNNPTGTVIAEKEIKQLLEAGKEVETCIVIDEAFVDFLTEDNSSLSGWLVQYPNLVLLRSLTKMYTIPGLRIGYVMAHQKIITVLKQEQIPWSINSIVDFIVPKLLTDTSYVDHTKAWLLKESQFIHNRLTEMDFYLSPFQVNFYLLRDQQRPDETEKLFRFLLENGIVTRHTHNFKGLNGEYLRLAIRSHEENEQLVKVLQKWRDDM
ncbi:threonine-phosphate decarboxylase CobD [Metabacillus halosaccharovorans]|uniref:threonine-phosphate decarboxylase n=1 Tax=Metabacillus halosaccharovorans TaxID=930124 RepID=A0ABT3DD82_9BACI|nr:threonine-phosphate decarboxylase CobD [Metabacillus halosaccharovorans]MCV9885013.1 threonine-phosphate decarboxylase CobD [Metabacillus halosaccharovorans]